MDKGNIGPQQTAKILLIEDEKPIARALELKLSQAGFTVKTAFDGEEAIKYIKSDQFDLIMTDIVMPRIDGFKVLEYLQQVGNRTPVIVTSNLSQKEDEEKAKSMGAIAYLVKSNMPITQIILFVKQTLGK